MKAGVQLTAQDINPIAYAPEFTWPNFTHRHGIEPGRYAGQASEHVLALAVIFQPSGHTHYHYAKWTTG